MNIEPDLTLLGQTAEHKVPIDYSAHKETPKETEVHTDLYRNAEDEWGKSESYFNVPINMPIKFKNIPLGGKRFNAGISNQTRKLISFLQRNEESKNFHKNFKTFQENIVHEKEYIQEKKGSFVRGDGLVGLIAD